MDTSQEFLAKLHLMLESEDFKSGEFLALLNEFIDRFNPKLKVLDFVYFDEERLAMLKEQKFSEVKRQNFTLAARLRDQEKQCRNYLELRKTAGAEKSMFYHDDEYLCFFNLGTCRNDTAIMEILREMVHEKD